MSGSKREAQRQAFLDRLFDELNEVTIALRIDAPVQAAAQSFALEQFLPFSHRSFHAAIGGFVQHMYRHGVNLRQELSFEGGLAEGIHLLESAYEGTHSRGYDAAYLDAAQPPPGGLSLVLSRMSGGMISVQRQRYIQSILTRALGPMGWEERRELVEFLLKQHPALVSAPLSQRQPGQWVEGIRELIMLMVGQYSLLSQVASYVSTSPT